MKKVKCKIWYPMIIRHEEEILIEVPDDVDLNDKFDIENYLSEKTEEILEKEGADIYGRFFRGPHYFHHGPAGPAGLYPGDPTGLLVDHLHFPIRKNVGNVKYHPNKGAILVFIFTAETVSAQRMCVFLIL